MIISNNREPNLGEFQTLVDKATLKLNDDAKSKAHYYITRGAQKLEDDVMGFLSYVAKGTKFEGSIKKISGQRFPDIVAAKYYGVEVKSSKDEKWVSLGGSVNESTRVEGVERIFLTFGKLTSPVEFRSRPYEDCLSEVVVTHYPRYKIDINLPQGNTIFDKMNTTYDELRLSQDSVGTIVDYYKSQLADGESLWWTGRASQKEDNHAVPMKIRLMRTLAATEKKDILALALAYFPEILGNANTKYERYVLWLAATQGIISTSTRDMFSAGGQGSIVIEGGKSHEPIIIDKMPRKIINAFENRLAIFNALYSINTHELQEMWKVDEIEQDPVRQWLRLAISYSLLEPTPENEEYNKKIHYLFAALRHPGNIAIDQSERSPILHKPTQDHFPKA